MGHDTRCDDALHRRIRHKFRIKNTTGYSLNALVDYQLGLADLKRRTLWDFEKNAPVEPIIQ